MSCMKTPQTQFGETVREMRLTLDLSQEMLAELTGLHRTYIGSVERGERNISLQNIVSIAHALQVTPAELLKDIK